jgi:hypothetical protein
MVTVQHVIRIAQMLMEDLVNSLMMTVVSATQRCVHNVQVPMKVSALHVRHQELHLQTEENANVMLAIMTQMMEDVHYVKHIVQLVMVEIFTAVSHAKTMADISQIILMCVFLYVPWATQPMTLHVMELLLMLITYSLR